MKALDFTSEEIVNLDRFHTDLFRIFIQALFNPGIQLPNIEKYSERFIRRHTIAILLDTDLITACITRFNANLATEGEAFFARIFINLPYKEQDKNVLLNLCKEYEDDREEDKPACSDPKGMCPSKQQYIQEKRLAAFNRDIQETRAKAIYQTDEAPLLVTAEEIAAILSKFKKPKKQKVVTTFAHGFKYPSTKSRPIK